jgi:hypothetical protein
MVTTSPTASPFSLVTTFNITVFYKIHPHQIFFAGVTLPALSKSSALGFLLKFSKGGVPGGGVQRAII